MTNTETCGYASFWRRLGAYVIDGMIVGPLQSLVLIAACHVFSPILLMVVFVMKRIVFFLYRPVCHARWGRTIGKMCFRLRVVGRDNSPLSCSQALLRELFFIPGVLFGMIAVVLVLRDTPVIGDYADFKSAMTAFYRGRALLWLQLLPLYSLVITILQAGFVVLHPQRRALHDLLAGTVVMQENRPPKESRDRGVHGFSVPIRAALSPRSAVPTVGSEEGAGRYPQVAG